MVMQCVDITFTNDMSKVAPVNETNCFNDSDIQFGQVFSTASLSGDAISTFKSARSTAALTAALMAVVAWVVL